MAAGGSAVPVALPSAAHSDRPPLPTLNVDLIIEQLLAFKKHPVKEVGVHIVH